MKDKEQTLRDQFASDVAVSLIGRFPNPKDYYFAAKHCYQWADAMLRVREESE